jgi:hypothetical protein
MSFRAGPGLPVPEPVTGRVFDWATGVMSVKEA